jgi:two-component system CheB/CheR fusion protein
MKSFSPGSDGTHENDHDDQLIVVGIGASAGGVQALKTFFEHVPENTGIAYVVILHLSPSFDSKLAEVLQSATKMGVTQVTEKTRVMPDHVYVVPPNQHLMMMDGYVAVSANMQVEDRRAPVDIFFRTLAESHRSRAVCVVLSGTGANGSMGLKRVKERGGAAFVQNPREAEFNEMPRNSIATDLVDEVLSVEDIPARIIAYKNNLGKVSIPVEAERRPQDQQQALREVFTQLRIRTGHDFSNYKRPTLLRRIERRINVRNLPDLMSYAAYIQQQPDETGALLRDLLISVTNFFRDKKAFEAVETEVIPKILRGKTAESQVRIWVAGCATGEEAYSIAMLFAEQTMNVIDAPKIQLFATDIDEAAIAHAREGYYSLNDAADVSPERLRRFFNKEGDGYRIRREIREMILFANHNFIKDPPFSHLNLVTCRNVLIYLNQSAQERVMETFHFALDTGGFLFLGSSESADSANDLYTSYNREHHIFQKRQIHAARAYPVPESVPNFRFEQAQKAITDLDQRPPKMERVTFGDLHQRLLEQYAPPSVVVNEEYDIVHLSERAGRYMQMAGGEPSKNLLKLVRQELRLELRAALYQAVQRQGAVDSRGLKLSIDDRTETINLHVRPVLQGDVAQGFILILFERIDDEAGLQPVALTSDEPVARQLEEELMRLKTQLRASNEQHEFHAEELKASNEELQAMNEELRSAAEELETSKEELQSINEELRTVNQELKVKVEETTIASNNLHNLINSVDIGTIFLDRSFKVAFFTPAARELFNLIPADYGRPLSDITSRLEYENLVADVELVLEKLQPVEREVSSSDGRVFIMRVLPYRTSEDRINGVVLTFVDVSRRMKAEQALRNSEERLRLIIEGAKDYAIFSLDGEGCITSWNAGAKAMMGYDEDEILGQSGDLIFVPEDREKKAPEKERQKAAAEGVAGNERWHLRKDGSRFYGSGTVRPLQSRPDGQLPGFVKIMRDLTETKRIEEARIFLASIVASSEDAIFTINFDAIITSWNTSAAELYGHPAEEAIGKHVSMLTIPGDIKRLLEDIGKIMRSEAAQLYDTTILRMSGQQINAEVMLSAVKDTAGEILGISIIARDITERLKSARELIESQDRFRTVTDAVPQLIWTNEANGEANFFNQRWYEYTGLSYEESAGPGWQAVVHPDDATGSGKRWQSALEQGAVFDAEYRLRRYDGVYRWFIGRNVPLKNASGHIMSWFGTATDIDDLKKVQALLLESRERMRITLESATDYAIITLGTNGYITSFSRGAELIFQYKEEEITGLYGGIIFTQEDQEAGAPEKEIAQATREGRALDERWHQRKDGSRFYMSGVMSPIRNDAGIVGFVKVARDMTQQKLLEQQKHDFIGIASHELKTPVTSIKAYTELLLEMFQQSSDAESAALMEKLNGQVDRMTQLIHSLLDTTKISEGTLPLYPEVLDLNELIQHHLEELQRLSQKHRIIFEPGAIEKVNADRERIGQVMVNLVSNAFKYSPEGGDVIVRTENASGDTRVSVQDFGIGVPAEHQSQIFDRFFRISNPRIQTFPGMGLGLYITAGIVQRHGGTISMESNQNKGSIFYFTLPGIGLSETE